MNNATGNLDFDIGSTDAYLDLPEPPWFSG